MSRMNLKKFAAPPVARARTSSKALESGLFEIGAFSSDVEATFAKVSESSSDKALKDTPKPAWPRASRVALLIGRRTSTVMKGLEL